jgi:hypothetical protein
MIKFRFVSWDWKGQPDPADIDNVLSEVGKASCREVDSGSDQYFLVFYTRDTEISLEEWEVILGAYHDEDYKEDWKNLKELRKFISKKSEEQKVDNEKYEQEERARMVKKLETELSELKKKGA